MAAVAAIAAVPALAQADHSSSLPPCPTGVPLQNTVNTACTTLQGAEHSVQQGGTRQAVEELGQRQQATVNNLKTQQEQAVSTKVSSTTGQVDSTKQAATVGVGNSEKAAQGVPAHVDSSERQIEESFVPSEQNRNFACPVPATNRPLADHAKDQACGLVGNLIGVPTQAQLEAGVRNLLSLGDFDEVVTASANAITGAVQALVGNEPTSIGQLVNAALGNTDSAGSQTITNVYEAGQCVRKGDYGDGARSTPCPR